MKSLAAAFALCLALTACKQEEAAPVASAAHPAAAPAAAAPAAAPAPAVAASHVEMPAECSAYLERVKACLAKSGNTAATAAVEQGLQQSKAQWEAVTDKVALASACKAASEQFTATATALKCE